jgi:ABC-2 type transport system ATP-binding protein
LNEAVVREIEQVLARHGAKVHKVDHPAVTLEELFLRIVKQSQERPGQRFTAGEQDGQNSRGPSPPTPEPAGTAQRHN